MIVVEVGVIMGWMAEHGLAHVFVVCFVYWIAKEVGTRGITVNCIAPGWIDTEMTVDLPEDLKKDLLDRIPVGKIGRPEDIAHAAVFLASDEASYITGQTITVDGGRVIN